MQSERDPFSTLKRKKDTCSVRASAIWNLSRGRFTRWGKITKIWKIRNKIIEGIGRDRQQKKKNINVSEEHNRNY